MNPYRIFMELTALECAALAIVVYVRNRHRDVGGWISAMFMVLGVWAYGFSRYFLPLDADEALFWAKVTLTGTIFIGPFYLQSMLLLIERPQPRLAAAAFACAVGIAVLLWSGQILLPEIRPIPHYHHYIQYKPTAFLLVVLQNIGWTAWAVIMQLRSLRRLSAYKRNQVLYYLIVAAITFASTSLIIIPIEFGLHLQPFPIAFLPVNFALLAYVLTQARLMEINLAIGRALIYAGTLGAVLLLTLGILGGVLLLAPDFLSVNQIWFVVIFVGGVATLLAVVIPPFLPRAERFIAQKFLRGQMDYQEVVGGLIKKLTLTSSTEELLSLVCDTLLMQMGLTRVAVYLRDEVSNKYVPRHRLGYENNDLRNGVDEESELIRWLGESGDCLIRAELELRASAEERQKLFKDLDAMKADACVPMRLDNELIGWFALSDKRSGAMFYRSDIELLASLGAETALALKYRRMEQEMFRKNRLIELGTIAAGVAHEIRNPLASIRTYAQLLPERADDPEFKGEFSRVVLNDVERITRVVETMLEFARPSQVAVESHRLDKIIEEALVLVQPRLNAKRIKLVKQIDLIPPMNVNKQQIVQVVVNIVLNAVDAVSEHGEIRVKAGIVKQDAVGPSPRQSALVEISDNGPGIPPTIRNRLFDPFFTTKKDGTGLGLSISQKIVRDHGGIVTVSSVEGQGATFQIQIPIA
jgi:two-component system NtrC family sensor kinase